MTKTTVNKSAKTGRFVSAKEVKAKPSTTFVQTVTKPSGGKGKKS
ncbi:hypothetical protein [Vreelandella aquamarina]|nr:hypothetical protein [Halomonas meridiana]